MTKKDKKIKLEDGRIKSSKETSFEEIKTDYNLTLQDWIDKLTHTVINMEEVLAYKIKHEFSDNDYFIVLEAKRPRYSVSDMKHYKNNIEIFSYVKDEVKTYQPSFIELSMNNWQLVDEDCYNIAHPHCKF